MSDFERLKEIVYARICMNCRKAKECHETCETCDLYDDEVDNELRKETNKV